MTGWIRRWGAAYAVGTLLLLWLAFANGFPLVYADTGVYLRVGTEFYAPSNRPPTYGLVILPLYKLFGLWSVAVLQSLFTVWVVDRSLSATLGPRNTPILLGGTALLLAVLSGLPWFAGQILPDLFTGLAVLIAFAIIIAPPPRRWELWLLLVLLTGIVSFHLSFVPIVAGVAVILAGLGWLTLRSCDQVKRAGLVIATSIVAMLGICGFNLIAHGQFKPSTDSGVFLLGRLLDARIAQPTLDRLCEREKLALCRMKTIRDPANPIPGQSYMWGGDRDLLTPAEIEHLPVEEKRVIDQVIADSPGAVARNMIDGIGRQLVEASVGDGIKPYTPDKQIHRQITLHFLNEAPAWLASREQRGTIQGLRVLPERAIGLVAALFNLPILIVALRRRDHALAALALTTIATLLLNAIFCSVLSGVYERFQARILWMPLLTIVAAGVLWMRRPAVRR